MIFSNAMFSMCNKSDSIKIKAHHSYNLNYSLYYVIRNDNLIEYYLFSNFMSNTKNMLGLFDRQ